MRALSEKRRRLEDDNQRLRALLTGNGIAEFYKAQAVRLSTFDKSRAIACGEDLPRYLALPRGCLDEVITFLEGHKVKRVVEVYDYVDANVLMLARMYNRRLKGYGDMGYKIVADAQQRLNI